MQFCFLACKNDGLEPLNDFRNSAKITTRTCDPGSLSESNGRIVFDDIESFLQTLSFLNCATESEITDWSGNLSSMTAQKALREFNDLTSSETTSDLQFSTAMENYEDKVKIWTNSDGDYEIDELFPVFR